MVTGLLRIARDARMHRPAAAIFFVLVAALGAGIFRDYGLSWDEPTQHDYGRAVYDYVFHGSREHLHDERWSNGPAFEFALFTLERLSRLSDTREVFLMRHGVTFLTFLLATFCFWRIGARYHPSRAMALAGALILVLNPRIFAHAFYNSKDIPFLAAMVVATWTLLRSWERPGYRRVLLHAMASAVLIDIRSAGLLMPALTIGYFVIDAWTARRDRRRVEATARLAALYAGATAALIIVFAPTLWTDPARVFAQTVTRTTDFRWHFGVLYLGRQLQGGDLPWHYVPVWMLITIPPFCLLAFSIGVPPALRRLCRRSAIGSMEWKRESLVLALVFIPLLAVIVFHATVYDGWRHLFFVYPGMVLLMLSGSVSLIRGARRARAAWLPRLTRLALAVAWAIQLATVAGFMISVHPFQDLYFNGFTGGIRGAAGRFDLDYWGLSYVSGLRYVVSHDPRPVLRIAVPNYAGEIAASMLPAAERSRIRYVKRASDTDYILTNYRWHPEPYPYRDFRSRYREVHTVDVEGVTLLSVLAVPH